MTPVLYKIASKVTASFLCCRHSEWFDLWSLQSLLVHSFQITFWHRCILILPHLSIITSLSPLWSRVSSPPFNCHQSPLTFTQISVFNLKSRRVSWLWRKGKRGELMERKWNFPAVCWTAEVLSKQTLRWDDSEHSRSKATEQCCPAVEQGIF